MQDGESMTVGDVTFVVEGPFSSILTAERLVLNCMQRIRALPQNTAYCKIVRRD